MLTIATGIFLAIPYGLLADRRGRKPTLCLSIPGFALNCIIMFLVMWYSDVFPLRAVWVSCLAWLFGGGPVVAFAIIWTMMSDVTTEEERYGSSINRSIGCVLTVQGRHVLQIRRRQYGR